MEKILVIGACGQIGVELVLALRKKHGNENIFAVNYLALLKFFSYSPQVIALCDLHRNIC